MKTGKNPFLVRDTLPTPSTDHRGIQKDCLLRKDICTDEYTHNTKNRDSLLSISNITPGVRTGFNDRIKHVFSPKIDFSKYIHVSSFSIFGFLRNPRTRTVVFNMVDRVFRVRETIPPVSKTIPFSTLTVGECVQFPQVSVNDTTPWNDEERHLKS